jgi:hypothetical protein
MSLVTCDSMPFTMQSVLIHEEAVFRDLSDAFDEVREVIGAFVYDLHYGIGETGTGNSRRPRVLPYERENETLITLIHFVSTK